MNERECIRVRHTIEDVDGTPHHAVYVYEPVGLLYKYTKWPVTAECTGLDAIWAGVDEAREALSIFDVDWIAVHSSDAEAFAAYCAEIDAR